MFSLLQILSIFCIAARKVFMEDKLAMPSASTNNLGTSCNSHTNTTINFWVHVELTAKDKH